MGYMNYVYGFIEGATAEDEFNRVALGRFVYDETWPLPDIFCFPNPGRRVAMISFALAFKSVREDWVEWLPRFESLLGVLHATYARVDWNREVDGDLISVEYICQDIRDIGQWEQQPITRDWLKFFAN